MLLLAGITGFCLLIYAGFILRNAWYFAIIPYASVLSEKNLPSVSVIVPARNEAANIESCLYSILEQEYPDHLFEVILVDDHSSDATVSIAQNIASRYPNLKVISIGDENTNSYKKAALTAGIALARGEIVVQTDGDCYMGKKWLISIVSFFEDHTAMVSGPVKIDYRENLLERFQAFESLGLVAIGAGSIAAGKPNMCNGANLAYRKSAFFEVGGFGGIDAVASGDDELLMQKFVMAGDYNIRFAKSREAVVSTRALSSWKSLKAQRLRWVSKARYYKNRRVNYIQMVAYLGFLFFPLAGILSFFDQEWLLLLSGLFGVKLVADLAIMYQSAKFFHKLRLLPWILPMQLIYIPYVLWVGLAGNMVKTYNWKGRTVR
ncbi:MAG: glycosyltransferase [Bacteroidia bacterium]